MRGLLLAALLAAPSSAAVRSAAAPAVSARSPLAHVAALKARRDLGAGEAFLDDQAARAWVLANRPDAAAVFEAAYRSHDLSEMLAEADSPRALRAALLSRADDPVASSPARLMEAVRRDPELAPQAKVYAEAALEWDALPPQAHAILSRDDERSWPSLTLRERDAALRRAIGELWAGQPPAADLAELAPRYKAFVETWGWLSSPVQAQRQQDDMAVHQSLLAGTKRVEEALRRAGREPARHPLLRAIDEAADSETALAALAQANRELGLPLDAGGDAARLDLGPQELARLRRDLTDAVFAELDSDPRGRELAAFAREHGIVVKIRLGPSVWGANADLKGRAVELTEPNLADLIKRIGATPGGVLMDREAVRVLAAYYAPVLVHELTHHKQYVENPGLLFRGSRLEWEFEAYTAGAAFAKRKLESDPTFRARFAKTQKDFHAALTELDNELVAPALWGWLKEGPYAGFPTLRLVAARQLAGTLRPGPEVNEKQFAAVERELAWRRRMPRLLRDQLELQETAAPSPARLKTTSYLRWLRDQARRAALETIEAVDRAVESLGANVEADYRSLPKTPARD